MSKKINLMGQRFGRLTVIKDTKKRAHNGGILWLCHCDCGNLTESRGDHLQSGRIQSCGCLHDELFEINRIKYRYKHGDGIHGKRPRIYMIWQRIIGRCGNPNNKDYKYYGAKGIKICAEWRSDYLAFKNWALANGYADNLTIDRIDSNGDYCPKNCQWITNAENARKAQLEKHGA